MSRSLRWVLALVVLTGSVAALPVALTGCGSNKVVEEVNTDEAPAEGEIVLPADQAMQGPPRRTMQQGGGLRTPPAAQPQVEQ